MNSSKAFLLLSILYFSCCGLTLARVYPNDIRTTPKDDCKNICGRINTDVQKSSCGDPDKRNDKFLLVHEESENNEEKTEYFEPITFECVNACPANYQKVDNYDICVKDPVQFLKDTEKSNKGDPINEKLDYTWWIVGGVAGLLIVALIVAFIFIKKRSG